MTEGFHASGFGEANTSYWLDSIPQSLRGPFDCGDPDARCDIAIVGGGFSGLWTAYYLSEADPTLSISIFEAQHVAHGATGRNGGWVLGLLTHQGEMLAGHSDDVKAAARSQIAATVDEVGRVAGEHGIECGFHKGGMLRIAARHPYQLAGLEKYKNQMLAECGAGGFTELDAGEAAREVAMRDVMGGAFFPHCAVVNPAALALGLSRTLRERGVRIFENAPVRETGAGFVKTDHGTCEAGHVVLATEGYSSSVPALENRIVSVYSHVIATEPLSPERWRAVGLSNRQAFSDTSGSSTYGQMTVDGRLVFGALSDYPKGGIPGGVTPSRLRDQHQRVGKILRDLFPQLEGVAIDRAWSGPLGMARGWAPMVAHEEGGRLTFLGGYGGRGVAASNLFGRSAAELIIGTGSFLTTAPWVRREKALSDALGSWEGEPLRTIGATMALSPGAMKDRIAMSKLPAAVQKAGMSLISLIPPVR